MRPALAGCSLCRYRSPLFASTAIGPSLKERNCNRLDGPLSRCVAIVTGTVIHTQALATLFQPVSKH
jgi:hypothetical protein